MMKDVIQQVFALVGSVPSSSQINEPMYSAMTAISSMNFNFQILALECSTPSLTYFGYLGLKLSVPFVLVIMVWLVVLVCKIFGERVPGFKILHNLEGRYLMYAGVSTSCLLLSLLYLMLTQAVLSYASCTKLENGPWVLDASPDVECFGSIHLQWLWLFVLGLVVYVFGVPLAILYVVVILRPKLLKKHKFKLPDWYEFCFGFLVTKYRAYVYGW